MSGLDIDALTQAISQAATVRAAFHAWQAALEQLRHTPFDAGNVLPQQFSHITDAFIQHIASSEPSLAFFALGDYSQHLLLPYAPISILVLVENHVPAGFHHELEHFASESNLQFQAHSVAELIHRGEQDAHWYGQLLAARFIAGHQPLANELLAQRQLTSWDSAEFFNAITTYSTPILFSSTPNLALCHGGLDSLTQGTLIKHFAVNAGYTASPYVPQLLHNQQQLVQICWQLQCHEQTAEYELQHPAASALAAHIERQPRFTLSTLLEHIYVLTLENARLLRLEQQYLREQYWPETTSFNLINRRFLQRHGYVDTIHSTIFARWPFAILEMLALSVEETGIKGFTHQSLTLAHANKDALQLDSEEQHYWFLRLIYRHQQLFDVLMLLHQFGILEQHIPEFGTHKGKLAHSQGLKHPMDVEALLMVQRLQQLLNEPQGQTLAAAVGYHIPQPGLLYIVGLFHHLHRQRSHCIQAAHDFCQRHALPSWETELVVWLLEHQDLLLHAAEQQDINQPRNIYALAQNINNLRQLDYLYLLSCAKLSTQATPQQLHWQLKRLNALYHACKKALRRGSNNPVANSDWANDTRQQAAKLLAEQAVPSLALQRLWAQIGDEYFLRETPTDIAWHTQAILRHGSAAPLVLLRDHLHTQHGDTQVFIYTKDSDYLFATTVKTLEELGLSVAAANIITSAHGFSLDTYTVMDAQQKPITDPQTLSHIQETLTTALGAPSEFAAGLPASITPPSSNNTQVLLANSADGFYTVVNLQTQDQPGLLTQVAQVFADFGFNLHHARIATYGHRVEDTFHISDNRGLPLSEAQQGIALQNALISALG